MRAQEFDRAEICRSLTVNNQDYQFYSLTVALKSHISPSQLPYSTRFQLEQLLHTDSTGDNFAIALHGILNQHAATVSFRPERLIMQSSSDLSAFADLAMLHDHCRNSKNQPNPALPIDLILDHSPPVGRQSDEAQQITRFTHWCQQAFNNVRLTLPYTEGSHPAEQQRSDIITHRIATKGGVWLRGEHCASSSAHSNLFNALGVSEWHISTLEAEALLLGQPLSTTLPNVVGIMLHNTLPQDCRAEDLACYLARLLNSEGLTHCHYEFCGPGLKQLTLSDRIRLARTCQSLNINAGYCPIDEQTLRGLTQTGHSPRLRNLVEAWAKAQYLLYQESAPVPDFYRLLHIDLARLKPDPIQTRLQHNTHRIAWKVPSFPTDQNWNWKNTPVIQPPEPPPAPESIRVNMRILARLDAALYNQPLARFYENALAITDRNIPTVIFGNHGYGSDRNDQAARTLSKLGVRAVICQSFSQHERRNLICMGIYPLKFVDGDSWQALNLNGHEVIVLEISGDALPGETVMMTVQRENNRRELVELELGLETDEEIYLCQESGMLPIALKRFLSTKSKIRSRSLF
ncbi:MAG: aconitase family protein [Marinobacterium sp.]|nr:aconitase family protein [Marinobacterium sp.]